MPPATTMRTRNQVKQAAKLAGSVAADNPNLYPGFLDLPIELILMVLTLLDNDDLYSLSLLNKGFHQMALPMFLKNNNFGAGGKVLYLHKPPYDVLRGLRIALFIEELTSVIVCPVMNTNSSELGAKTILTMFRELARLISRLRHVTFITLDLKFQVSAHEAEILEGFADLMVAIGETSCGLLRVGGWNIGLQSGREIAPLTALKFLRLQFSKLCPSFQDWAIRSINSSLITHLSLDDVALSKNSLSLNENLHLLTLPALQALVIISIVPIPFEDIAAFLCRHPGIIELTLKCGDLIPPGAHTLPVDALPTLITMCSTPRYICHFLSPRGSLPNMRRVKIDRFVAGPKKDCMVDVEDCLSRLARREKIDVLGISFPRDLYRWLANGSYPRRGKRRDVERTLQHIKILFLSGFLRPNTQSMLPHWLSLFPSLQHVDFSFFDALTTPAQRAQFKSALIVANPELGDLQMSFFGILEAN